MVLLVDWTQLRKKTFWAWGNLKWKLKTLKSNEQKLNYLGSSENTKEDDAKKTLYLGIAKIKDKDKIWKETRGKEHYTYKGKKNYIQFLRNTKARREWNEIFKEKKHQHFFCTPENYPSKVKEKQRLSLTKIEAICCQ